VLRSWFDAACPEPVEGLTTNGNCRGSPRTGRDAHPEPDRTLTTNGTIAL
jgi:hypothetical protein